MSRWDVGEICVFIFTVTVCTLGIILVTHWVWGPNNPAPVFSAKEEYVKSCKKGSFENVPNVGSDNTAEWTCVRVK